MGHLVRFESTVWTVIESARRRDPTAIEQLITDYSPPLLGFIRNRGFSPEDAEDILQEVLLRVSDGAFLVKADRARGKFRSVLLGVTKNCILKHYEREDAVKRGGRAVVASLEDLKVNEEGEIPIAAAEPEDFNRLWAENLFRLALRMLREHSAQNGTRQFDVLTRRLKGRSYNEISDELGVKETDVTNLLHAAKEKLKEFGRQLIASYSSSESEFTTESGIFQAAWKV